MRPRPSSGRPRRGAPPVPEAGAGGASRRRRGGGRDGTPAGARPPRASTRPGRRAGSQAAGSTARARARRRRGAGGVRGRRGAAVPSSGTPTTSRRSSRKAKYGVPDSYCSHAPRRTVIPSACVAQLLEQPRLPDPCVAHELDERPEPHPDRTERSGEQRELARSPDERRTRDSVDLRPRHRADGERHDLFGLALRQEPRQRLDRERGPGALEDGRSGEDLSRARPRHEARRERRRVAEDRVRPPERRPDLAGEHAPVVDPRAKRQRRGVVEHGAQRAQHPFLVVLGRLGSACDEDDPAAVGVDVRLEEAHAVVLGRLLNGPNDLLDRRRRGRRIVRRRPHRCRRSGRTRRRRCGARPRPCPRRRRPGPSPG